MIARLFTEIQSTTAIVGVEDTFYAVFNTPENSIAGSAVCSFSLSDLTTTFEESPFKNQVRRVLKIFGIISLETPKGRKLSKY